MLFNSYVFILAFLPITLTGYYLVNKIKKYQLGELWLLIASFVFIGYLDYRYVLAVFACMLLGYAFVCGVCQKNIIAARKKKLLIVGIIVHVGILLYFKYTNFFIETLNSVVKSEFSIVQILIPIGISFYTFQQIAFLVDCYKDPKVKCTFLEYSIFIAYFPKLLQGPILLHGDMLPALRNVENKKFCMERFCKGLYAFSLGLAKKVLLADNIALIVDAGYQNIGELNAVSALLTMVGYSLQLYFDFSGYCDMATGIGEMLQIPVLHNFDSPYKATSVTEIWDRWHMTLTRFFTRYIYIPLGGSRKGLFRMYANTFIVFLISGLWHGAAWTFVIWGIMHGVAMIISKLLRQFKIVLPKVVGWGLTFSFWVVSFAIFRADSLKLAEELFGRLKSGGWNQLYSGFYEQIEKHIEVTILQRLDVFNLLEAYPNILVIAFVGVLLIACLFMKNTMQKVEQFRFTYPKLFVTVGLLVYSLLSLESVTVFLYANF